MYVMYYEYVFYKPQGDYNKCILIIVDIESMLMPVRYSFM